MPAAASQSVTKEKSRRIGLYFEVFGRGIDVGRGVLDYVLRYRPSWQMHTQDSLPKGTGIDAVIANSADPRNKDGCAVEPGMPVVDINFNPAALDVDPLARQWSAGTRYAHILPDDLACGRRVAEYFLARGFTNFAFFGFEEAFSRVRQQGFEQALASQGRLVSVYGNPGETWETLMAPQDMSRTKNWLAGLAKPLAVMASTDRMARRVISACQESGLSVPHTVAVCGVNDDLGDCELTTPTLSSIPVNCRQIGYEAARLLDEAFAGKTLPATLLVEPPPVITRQSSNVFPAADADVSAALRYIYDHADRPISVEEVADAMAVSRASLDRRFREFHARSIQREIWCAHVERAKRFLVSTRADARAVARMSGFHNAERLSVVFRREVGMTPSAYRKIHARR